MNWMGDSLFAGSMITTPHKNVKMEDFADDTKDIFGKPVQTLVAPKKSSALKMQAKPDFKKLITQYFLVVNKSPCFLLSCQNKTYCS